MSRPVQLRRFIQTVRNRLVEGTQQNRIVSADCSRKDNGPVAVEKPQIPDQKKHGRHPPTEVHGNDNHHRDRLFQLHLIALSGQEVRQNHCQHHIDHKAYRHDNHGVFITG